ncbi:hypothetical protein [Amphibacillus cookii]|uniref:hypothetical protein n=1 Tax=Amphibacillus cookii TaxID=767787 RepID=UPI0019564665|nr:hypothetical protein [Amphibacillus cookii]MBM7541156.1 glutathione S-transferase [Amphibacillus cookii]
MKRSKRGLMMILIMIGLMAIAGTTYGYVQHQNDQRLEEQLTEGQNKVRASCEELDTYLDEQGFMTEAFAVEKIETIKTNLISLQTTYSEMTIRKGTLKETADQLLHNIDTLLDRADQLLSQYDHQQALNQFFVEDAITGNEVTHPVIVENLDHEKLEAYYEAFEQQGFDEETTWYQAIAQVLEDASEQLTQIETAEAAVAELFNNDEVIKEPSRSIYENARVSVANIRNVKIKEFSDARLDAVLKIIEENEAKANRLAEEMARAENQQLTQEQSSQTSGNANSAGTSSQVSTGESSPSDTARHSESNDEHVSSSVDDLEWKQVVKDEPMPNCEDKSRAKELGCATYDAWITEGKPEDFKDLFED